MCLKGSKFGFFLLRNKLPQPQHLQATLGHYLTVKQVRNLAGLPWAVVDTLAIRLVGGSSRGEPTFMPFQVAGKIEFLAAGCRTEVPVFFPAVGHGATPAPKYSGFQVLPPGPLLQVNLLPVNLPQVKSLLSLKSLRRLLPPAGEVSAFKSLMQLE